MTPQLCYGPGRTGPLLRSRSTAKRVRCLERGGMWKDVLCDGGLAAACSGFMSDLLNEGSASSAAGAGELNMFSQRTEEPGAFIFLHFGFSLLSFFASLLFTRLLHPPTRLMRKNSQFRGGENHHQAAAAPFSRADGTVLHLSASLHVSLTWLACAGWRRFPQGRSL